jgi:anti-anti-sigma factor
MMCGDLGRSSEFSVAVAVDQGSTVVSVRGDIDMATAPRLRQVLIDATSLAVVVDLSAVTFMDASGLGVLVGAARLARNEGRDLVLRDPSPSALRVLQVTGMLDARYPRIEAARKIMPGEGRSLVSQK